MIRRCTLLIAFTVVLGGSAAHAQDAPADAGAADEKEAIAAYGAGDFARAAAAFERAYRASERFGPLFGWAQAERQLGHCARARELYQKVFVHPDLPTDAAAKVKLAMEQPCTPAAIAADAAPPPAEVEPDPAAASSAPGTVAPPQPAPSGRAPSPSPSPVAVSAERRPWYRDAVGDVLLGAGVLAVGVGGYELSASFDTEDSVAGLPTLPMQDDRLDRARRERTVGIVGLAVGGALIAGAVLRYLTLDGPRDSTPVVSWTERGGVTLGYAGRF